MESGELVDGEADDGGDDESVCGDSENVGKLDVELLPALVDPAARHAVVHAIEADDVVGAEQAVEEEANHAGDAVLGEYVHCVVDVDEVLDLSGVIADNTRDDSQEDTAVGHDEPGCWGCCDEAGNDT